MWVTHSNRGENVKSKDRFPKWSQYDPIKGEARKEIKYGIDCNLPTFILKISTTWWVSLEEEEEDKRVRRMGLMMVRRGKIDPYTKNVTDTNDQKEGENDKMWWRLKDEEDDDDDDVVEVEEEEEEEDDESHWSALRSSSSSSSPSELIEE